ncbi:MULTISPECIES: type VI secretion system baseplate subunit TssF [Halorhodospira]|uniref:type VI secretion system baseplate subunit TssF n=1 Tax=Halorhodospira TaxID=85108 RepID=UPI001EE87C09|nr:MULTISPECIES: type VI secretion system baseplate subunit TssF [Halorhodospira]MCG5528268.1 type VI secretion system baseplate subunit TssF [Halorhodospira halophila]MCG5543925.1 type VI secretion system baseplate subunit TssF [Halorhodospira sp. 9628]
MDLRRAFEQEMRRLSEAGAAFARAFPTEARMLGLEDPNDRDPYVERLLEGIAFLTAGVHAELAAGVEDLHQQLLHLAAPELAEPWPSATVLAFSADDAVVEPVALPRNTEVWSATECAEGVAIPFVTLAAGTVEPIEVERAEWLPGDEGGSEVRLVLRFSKADAGAPEPPANLPLFIDAEAGLWERLRAALLHGTRRVRISRGDGEPGRIIGGGELLTPWPVAGVQAGAGEPIVAALDHFRCFFLARPLLAFIQLRGLDGVELPAGSQRLEVRCEMNWPAPAAAAGVQQLLRANCLPAVNSGSAEAEAQWIEGGPGPYSVCSDADGPGCRIVHQVLDLRLREASSGRVHVYQPPWQSGLDPEPTGMFRVQRRQQGGGEDVAVRLDAPAGPGTLGARVRYSHGDLPRRCLGRGDVKQPGTGVPDGVAVTNLRRPSRFQWAALEVGRFQALSRLIRGDAERWATREGILELVAALADAPNSAAAEACRAALRDVTCRPTVRVRQGVVETGLHVVLELDPRPWRDPGEAYLFAEGVYRVLAAWAPLDRFVVLGLRLETGDEVAQWPRS